MSGLASFGAKKDKFSNKRIEATTPTKKKILVNVNLNLPI